MTQTPEEPQAPRGFDSAPSSDPESGPTGDVKPDERNLAVLSHIGALAGAFVGFGHIAVPLVIYLLKKDESEFVRGNALESLNFQITMTLAAIVSGILTIILIGFLGLLAIGILDIVCIVLATIRASNGETYRYPFTLRLVN